MIKLTRRQYDLLEFIRAYVADNGFSPSCQEITTAFGAKSKNFAFTNLTILEDRGYIRRLHRRARAIEIVATRDYHAADCPCDDCAATRYLSQVKLIQAIQNDPPARVFGRGATNFRHLSGEKRASFNTPNFDSGRRARADKPAGARL